MIEKGSVRQGDGAERSLRSAMVLNFIVKSEKRAAAQSRSAMVLNFTVRLENAAVRPSSKSVAHSTTALSEEKEAKQGPH